MSYKLSSITEPPPQYMKRRLEIPEPIFLHLLQPHMIHLTDMRKYKPLHRLCPYFSHYLANFFLNIKFYLDTIRLERLPWPSKTKCNNAPRASTVPSPNGHCNTQQELYNFSFPCVRKDHVLVTAIFPIYSTVLGTELIISTLLNQFSLNSVCKPILPPK